MAFLGGIGDPADVKGYLGGKNAQPPQPDLMNLARQQGEEDRKTAEFQAGLNRPNETNPFGSRTWAKDAQGNWSTTQSLSPEMQQRLQQELGIAGSLEQGAQGISGRAANSFIQPFDMSSIPSLPGAQDDATRQRVEAAISSRIEPQFQRQEDQLRTRLSNQGVMQGSEAFDNEMKDLNQARNDARMQAVLAGGQEQSRQFDLESQARQNAINDQQNLRSMPITELNALRGSAGLDMSQFMPGYQGYNNNIGSNPSPIFQAGSQEANNSIDAWNVGQQRKQQTGQAVGGMAMMAAMYF